MSRITFCLSCLCSFTIHLLDPGWGLDPPPCRGQGVRQQHFYVDSGCSRISSSGTSKGARRRRFLALMVGTPGSPAPTPPRGPTIDVFYVDGARSRISIGTS
jgi:hypothetical protein